MRSVLLAFFCLTLAAQNRTDEKEAALGRQMAQEIRRRSTPVQSQAVQDYVAQLGVGLSAGYTFSVVTGVSANALSEPTSLPGGYIFVPVNLLLAAQNESELAGMLAQAMARRPVVTHGGIASLWLVSGDGPLPIRAIGQWREMELESDTAAVATMSRAGFDPAALLRFIDRMQPEDSPYSQFPPRAERLERLRIAINALPRADYSESGDFRRTQDLVRPASPAPAKPRTPPSLFTK